jgi:nicotinamidase-related amidase
MSTQSKVLVVIDIQREYVTEGRAFHLKGIAPSLENAGRVLAKAREDGWDIVHVRHLQAGEIFNPESEYSGFVTGFEPIAGELSVVKSNFSSFSSPEFASVMERYKGLEIFVVGYGSTMCCLSTIIEGYHRGHRMVFVADASLAKSTARFDEASTHAYATDILATFSRITTATEVA